MFLKSSDYTYITSLEIENVKCFKEKQTLHFTNTDGRVYQWNILLGDNGTGKTTLLRSIAGINDNNRFEIYSTLLNFYELSFLKISCLFNNKPYSINIKKEDNALKVYHSHSSNKEVILSFIKELKDNIIAYGANRIGEKENNISPNETSTLIDDDAKLINVEGYFINLDYLRSKDGSKKSEREYNIVKEILKKVLPDVSDIRIITKGRRPFVEFQMEYGWIKYQDLSLGYQTVTAWMVD